MVLKIKEKITGEPGDLQRLVSELGSLREELREKDQKLDNIEAKHRNLVKLARDGIMTFDLKGNIISVNPSFMRLTGFSKDEIVGRHISQLPTLRKTDMAGFLKMFKSLLLGKVFKNTEFIYKRKDGQVRDGMASLSFYKNNGKISGVQAILSDVTEQKKIKEDLIESERRYRNLIETAPDGIVTLNAKGFITLVNPAFEKLSGYSENELVGKHFLKFPTAQFAKGLDYLKIFHAILRGRKPARLKYQYKRKDGEIRFAEAEIGLIKENGRLSEAQAICRDIKENKKAEEAIKDHDRRYFTFFENSPMPITVKDLSVIKKLLDRLKEKKVKDLRKYLDTNFYRIMPAILKVKLLEANKALLKMLEASSKEDLINNLGKIFSKDLFNYYKEAIIAYSKGKKEFSGETIFNTLKGNKVNVYMRMNIVPGSGDTLKKVLSTAIDITRQKKSDEELKESRNKLEKTLNGTINALASMAESRDPYTAGHQKRVTRLAVAIAQDMGQDEKTIEAVRTAALLHDIGKINVPSSILTKPGKISDIEFDMAKIHPQVGYEILKKIDFPWPIADIILQHHEKLDGSGYPEGLKEKDIKVEAKILAVADVVEAMSSNRPYRPSLGLNEAVKEITGGKGRIYDPITVDTCLKILKGKRLSLFDH